MCNNTIQYMGFDITVYSLLEITHKHGVAYIELARKGRNTYGAENIEKWDGDKRTKEEQKAYEDTFLVVDPFDTDDWRILPILIYEADSHDIDTYNVHNFIQEKKSDIYNELLDTKIQDNICGYFSPNENDEDYEENNQIYIIYEKGAPLKAKSDIISIHKVIQKKWSN